MTRGTRRWSRRWTRSPPVSPGTLVSRAPGHGGDHGAYLVDDAAAQAWKKVASHLAAQHLGRERLYSHYRVRVATVHRDYGPDQENTPPAAGPATRLRWPSATPPPDSRRRGGSHSLSAQRGPRVAQSHSSARHHLRASGGVTPQPQSRGGPLPAAVAVSARR